MASIDMRDLDLSPKASIRLNKVEARVLELLESQPVMTYTDMRQRLSPDDLSRVRAAISNLDRSGQVRVAPGPTTLYLVG